MAMGAFFGGIGLLDFRLMGWRGTVPLRGWPVLSLARPKRFELLTPRFVVWCSIQLSYGRAAGQGSGWPARRGT